MEIGDFVRPLEFSSNLESFNWPFVLVSETFDMLWTKIPFDKVYPIKHKADPLVLAGCMERYARFKESYI